MNCFQWLAASVKKTSNIQVVILLHVVELDTLEAYNMFSWEGADDKNKVVKILEKFEGYCIPRRNIT